MKTATVEQLLFQKAAQSAAEHQEVVFWYENHRGEYAVRHVRPVAISFTATEWHPEEQWILEAWDMDKKVMRSFALANIRKWTPANPVDGGEKKEVVT